MLTEEWDVYDDLLLEKAIINRRAPWGGHRGYAGGQFIPTVLWEAEKCRAEADLPGCLARFGDRIQFLNQLYQQQVALGQEGTTKVALIPLSTVEARLKVAVAESYREAFLLGKRAAGNLTSLTAAEEKAIKKIRLDEFVYLRGFLKDMRDGAGAMSYERRMSMYQAAAKELFAVGFVLGDIRPDRMIAWILGRAEHCSQCLEFANNGPYLVQDFIRNILRRGYVPGSGKLLCRTGCKCHLEEVKA